MRLFPGNISKFAGLRNGGFKVQFRGRPGVLPGLASLQKAEILIDPVSWRGSAFQCVYSRSRTSRTFTARSFSENGF